MPHPSTLLPAGRDTTKTVFKSSTRLECMMQDFPKALPQGAKVGFTTVNQVGAAPGGAPETTASYGNLSRSMYDVLHESLLSHVVSQHVRIAPSDSCLVTHCYMLAVYTC